MHKAAPDKYICFIFKRFKIILEDKSVSTRKKKKPQNPASIIGPCFQIFSSEEWPQRMILMAHAVQNCMFDNEPEGHA